MYSEAYIMTWKCSPNPLLAIVRGNHRSLVNFPHKGPVMEKALMFSLLLAKVSSRNKKNNAWVTVNNDFLSRERRFGEDFHEWRSHEWKSLPSRLTSEKISLFTVTNVLFYFLHAMSSPKRTIPLKTITDRWFRHCPQKHGLFWP